MKSSVSNPQLAIFKPVAFNCGKDTFMKKYLPHLVIIASIGMIIWNAIEGESFRHYISSIFIIIAMIFTIFDRKKQEKN